MNPFAISILISAFLLFQIQPIIGRYVLPWFGGAPSVWTACLLFFQLGLLLGYGYAHGIVKVFSLRYQCLLHSCLLLITLLLLPITPDRSTILTLEVAPMWQLLYLLTTSVGLPFVLLSASAPLLQYWFSISYPDRSPFRLYSLSNIGSLLALLSYPFVIEPLLGINDQTIIWTGIYFLLAASLFWTILFMQNRIRLTVDSEPPPQKSAPPITTSDGINWCSRLRWIALSALGAIMLLSATTQFTQNIMSVPLMWVLPLSCYLLSFIICFDHDRWYIREYWFPCFVIATTIMILDKYLLFLSLIIQVIIYLFAFFTACMICHGELVKIRPSATHLTDFYLSVSLGGALGGIMVNLIAPLLFVDYWEFYLALMAIVLLAGIQAIRHRCWFSSGQLSQQYVLHSLAISLITIYFASTLFDLSGFSNRDAIGQFRNFYGVFTIHEDEHDEGGIYRTLQHGQVTQGNQWLDAHHRSNPYSYYGVDSGIGFAMRHHPNTIKQHPLKVGLIGLGVGALSAYGREGDQYRFYEIDEAMKEIAYHYFSYLTETKADVEISLGDARIVLEDELKAGKPNEYDIIVVDAFNGDAIPVHLLTEEAAELYAAHLSARDGLLAIHITNDSLNLEGVVLNMAHHIGYDILLFEHDAEDEQLHDSVWLLLTKSDTFINDPDIVSASKSISDITPKIKWTDNFSNLLEVIDL